ncbi:MAG: rod shape-determining protein MreD [Thermodesulfobacteriota bacterium]|nr:rod shape-determining protein MreD [Thermodesulfobacteriota bacterium]
MNFPKPTVKKTREDEQRESDLMIYAFSFALTLLLMILQSTILAIWLPFAGLYDLLIPVVLYLAIFRPPGDSAVIIPVMGLITDAVTGGPFGVYILTYVWLFAGIRAIIRYIHGTSLVFLSLAVAVSVAVEHNVFWCAELLSGRIWVTWPDAAGRLVWQLVFAMATGPFLLLGTKAAFQKLINRQRGRF